MILIRKKQTNGKGDMSQNSVDINNQETDAVDEIIQQWINEGLAKEQLVAMETFGRIKRLENLFMKKAKELNREHANIEPWEFDVLATLRRSGKPFCLSPSELFTMTMVTSGTMTNRLTQLQKKGLIERLANPNDKRSLLVQLTKKGIELIDGVMTVYLKFENELLADMDGAELAQLNDILKKMEYKIERKVDD